MPDQERSGDKLRVFISYSRDDLTFADQLKAALDGTGFSATIDRHGIPGADEWLRRLQELIRDADTVVFVLSPASAASKWCRWEVERAVEHGKRIIPIVIAPLAGAAAPKELADLNYIYFLYDEKAAPDGGFGTGLIKLIGALNEDPGWLREHTRLLGLALHWDGAGRPATRLLFGDDIAKAKAWVGEKKKSKTQPTPLHLVFIEASEAEDRRRHDQDLRQLEEREQLVLREAAQSRRVAKVTSVGLATALALAGLAIWFGVDATHKTAEVERQRGMAQAEADKAAREISVVRRLVYLMSNRHWRSLMQSERERQLFDVVKSAAETGNAAAGRMLGQFFRDGIGVPVNKAQALAWFDRAASAGDGVALNAIGLMHGHGDGVPKDYTLARSWYDKAVAAGDPAAMVNIGNLHKEGNGVPKDYAEARKWYERAAAADLPVAMKNLGVMYESGLGMPPDYAKAQELYERAASAGMADAMNSIGRLYRRPDNTQHDYVKARDWFEKAAAFGDASAMFNLGLLFDNAQGVPRDYEQARKWYEKAEALGHSAAMRNIGILFRDGNGVTQDYVQARVWFKKAADAGDSDAMYRIGLLHEAGHGVPQDYDQAREWFVKAAEDGNSAAMNSLALLYANGHGVPQDYAMARQWSEKGVAEGNKISMFNLGIYLATGQGGPRDYVRARELLEKAAATGDKEAMNVIGEFYYYGQGVPRDFVMARTWFEKAATAGYAAAMYNLGVLFKDGEGGPQDDAKALDWYKKAADGGEDRAKHTLAKTYNNQAWATLLEVTLHGNPAEMLEVALVDATAAVRWAPADEAKIYLDTRGQILLALNQIDAALADLDQSIAQGAKFVGGYFARGRAHELKGNREAAISDYRKALDLLNETDSRTEYEVFAANETRKHLAAFGVSVTEPERK